MNHPTLPRLLGAGALALLALAGCETTAKKVDLTPTTTVAPAETTTTSTTAAPHVPTPAEFTIEVVETKRSCFGSAGCNVGYQIHPTYNGPPTDPAVTYTVIYEVRGGEDVKTDNFTMHGTKASVTREDLLSTPEGGPPLTAVVTRVLDN